MTLPDLETFTAEAKQKWALLVEQKVPTDVTAKILSYPTAMCPVNQPKNRYGDVMPNEGSRVYLGGTVSLGAMLQADVEEQELIEKLKQLAAELEPSDKPWRTYLSPISTVNYINANYILSTKHWICTQAPLLPFLDFWHMVWTNRVKVIFTLVNDKDTAAGKADQYWPGVVGESLTFGQIFKVTLLGADATHETCCGYVDRRFLIELCPELLEKVAKYKDQLPKTSLAQNNTQLEVHQLHHTQWPDFGCPSNVTGVFNMLKRGDELAGRSSFVWTSACATPSPIPLLLQEQTPLLVHCSAGLGRSGTLMMIYEIVCDLLREKTVQSVTHKLLELRFFRNGLVQTEDQYRFIYVAVWEYINKMQK
jgi:protein tyrosine phosphatase